MHKLMSELLWTALYRGVRLHHHLPSGNSSVKNILLVQETTTLNNLCYLKHTEYFLNHHKHSK